MPAPQAVTNCYRRAPSNPCYLSGNRTFDRRAAIDVPAPEAHGLFEAQKAAGRSGEGSPLAGFRRFELPSYPQGARSAGNSSTVPNKKAGALRLPALLFVPLVRRGADG